MGLHISFAGMLTFKNNDPLRAVAKAIPLDRLFSGNTVIDVPTEHIPFITGNSLANVLTGNDRVNAFLGGAGADTFVGGGGFDLVSYDPEDGNPALTPSGGITVSMTGGGSGTVTTSNLGTDSLVGISAVHTSEPSATDRA